MQFHELHLENFLSHQDSRLPLADQGLVLITADVVGSTASSSNGGGKSTLVDALIYALYGKTLRGLRGSDVVHWQFQRDCLVTLSGRTDQGQAFTIRRPQKHRTIAKVEVDLDGETYVGEEMAKAIIHDVILGGLSFEATNSALVFGRAGFFTQLEDADRKRVLEDLLGLGDLSH